MFRRVWLSRPVRPIRRLWLASVWAPGGVRPEDERFRGILRWVLPISDLLFLYFGVVGFLNGVRSVEDAAGQEWQAWWSLGIAVSAAVAFAGVAFPRLALLEAVGKGPLIVLVAVYIAVVLSRGVVDDQVLATAGLIVILVLLPLWRLADLGMVRWAQKRGRM